MNIENIHEVRKSYNKLFAMCRTYNEDLDNFHSQLESTQYVTRYY